MKNTVNIEEYMNTRVNSQIEWYEKRARSCKIKYTFCQTVEIILAALIPLLSSYANNYKVIGFIVGIFGAAIAIIKSLTKLYKWQENWMGYQIAHDLLRYQKILFETGSAPYNTKAETVENIFVHNIEQIISSEHNQWKSLTQNQGDINSSEENSEELNSSN